jgi:hypothetical protein
LARSAAPHLRGHGRTTGRRDGALVRRRRHRGFNFFQALPNTSLKAFVELAVPVLRARGLLRTKYAGETLRSHFQLPVAAGASVPNRAPQAVAA